jgi:alpha-1,6-mannosyltransferase
VPPNPAGALLSAVPAPRLRVADVALFYGERSGGIRTYLDAKAAYAAASGAMEHHVVVPGRRKRHDSTRHELRSLRLVASNGYRLPLGIGPLERTLERIEPDVILVHDPYWALLAATRVGALLDRPVVAVRHATSHMEAASAPGPSALWQRALGHWYRHSYRRVQAIMSAAPAREPESLPVLELRFGLDPAFRPRPAQACGGEVLYVGRLASSKGVFDLLEAAARSRDPWPLHFAGSGPARSAIVAAVRDLGLGDRVSFRPFIADRERLAAAYAAAGCVVMPGEFETFGLVALEAAASGANVVACSNAPVARVCGPLAHTFEPGDVEGMLDAIERARTRRRGASAAASPGSARSRPSSRTSRSS